MPKNNIFTKVKLAKPPRSTFDLSHDHKFSCNMGQLIPVSCVAALPSDTWRINHEQFVRFAPTVSPVMHRFDVKLSTYFVPYRILWDGFEDFINGGANLTPQVPPAFPRLVMNSTTWGSLSDHMGIPPPPNANEETISAMKHAAYQCVWNEYFRDQNLMQEVVWQLVDGDNTSNLDLFQLRNTNWEHDYFTSCLPDAQKGSAVDLPLGVIELNPNSTGDGGRLVDAGNYGTPAPTGELETDGGFIFSNTGSGVQGVTYDPNGTLQVSATTINALRTAWMLQKWLERNMVGGTRYAEQLYVHFQVKPQDARLQRPEFIGSSIAPVVISEVLNTTGTDDLPQGNMAGHGIAYNRTGNMYYRVQEYGYIITLMRVVPRTAYQQGINRDFLKINDFTQFGFPTFAHLGEQEVTNSEIYAYQGGTVGNETFGYQSRYAEYKYEPSRVSGEFRNSLDNWTAARIFDTPPALNADFVQCNPTFRIFAVTDPTVDHLYCNVLNRFIVKRPLPYYGTPL